MILFITSIIVSTLIGISIYKYRKFDSDSNFELYVVWTFFAVVCGFGICCSLIPDKTTTTKIIPVVAYYPGGAIIRYNSQDFIYNDYADVQSLKSEKVEVYVHDRFNSYGVQLPSLITLKGL